MMRIGSVCSGYGGLDMAVHAVFGGDLAWVADMDPGAAAILAHRFPGIPNYGDITTVDWSAVEPVDIFCAGFPCQPVSAAGRRKGISDERWLFDDICAAIGRMVTRPRLLVLENVPGLLSANGGDAMAHVIQGLAALGYVGRYRLLRASDAGAPHKRERWFCIAWPAADACGHEPGRHGSVASICARDEGNRPRPGDRGTTEDADRAAGGERRLAASGQAEGGRPRANAGRSGGAPAADAERDARTQDEPHRPATAWHRPAAADAQGDGRHEGRPESARLVGRPDAAIGGDAAATNWGLYELAVQRWEHATGRVAPRPTEPGKTGERLSPVFVEWMMGLPAGWVTDVPGLSRNAKLKALGNGVVPQQAALALSLLLDRAGFTEVGEAA